jgi:hypothetical protein
VGAATVVAALLGLDFVVSVLLSSFDARFFRGLSRGPQIRSFLGPKKIEGNEEDDDDSRIPGPIYVAPEPADQPV